ncbi:fumarylacetoacetate hydrolase family protein [Paenibacillus sp. S150]|uniref:fumarylacetoacetate hydrolase family protein n=1 Tax=Paenibacillus sp. S150 TaxID=2749826 RepID=UPI001C56B03A|nr:fumarylacetoacetate hydrolase family protein [Paenibacillus sp. S150]MBW4079796.1 fumarylacetoacetate hydrolase family protein [Paenibacillus sp. S150]
MRLVTLKNGKQELAAIAAQDRFVLVDEISRFRGQLWSSSTLELLQNGQFDELKQWYAEGGEERLTELPAIAAPEAEFAPLYRHPRKIWGIGMNYTQKAMDLNSVPPEAEPVCFMKPDTSLIGPGDNIVLPSESESVTAEAELGIVIGKVCKDIREEQASQVVAGFTPTLDMTCQDIHARNPRFLQRSKAFDTFFSLGPELVTADEIPDLRAVALETVLNGKVIHRNTVDHMMYNPWFIVSYFSRMMTLLPGDIIMTGTPGSTPLSKGDRAECRVSGFRPLVNPVAGIY